MDDSDFLAAKFAEHRPHLRAVAYRMLGSLTEADDAVQEAWLRLHAADTGEVDNLGGWLTTVVSRVCLNVLRSRRQRREEPLEVHLPDPVVTRDDGPDPEHEALLADSVGLALLIVLDTLSPAERLAFVLHDLFSVPFDEIATVIGRSEAATRQLASRARRRVRTAAPDPDAKVTDQRAVVDAFLAAARDGEIDELVSLLDPDVVVRTDGGAFRPSTVARGAHAVAKGASTFARLAGPMRPVLVNGAPGALVMQGDTPVALGAFTIVRGKILALNIFTDPERIARLDLTAIG